jgi:Tfp pilus assembly protein PilE
MARLISAVTVAAVLSICGCQSYSTGLKQSVDRTDETVAIATLHTIASAESTYSVSNEGNYASLAQLAAAGFLDSRFASDRPLKHYVLTLTLNSGSEPGYSCSADPGEGLAGRHFFLDSASGQIHANETQPASVNDPVIQ